MNKINKNKSVLVTGATGYVAGWLVKKLLHEGLTVHAAVRDPENKNKLKHLDEMAAASRGEIKYFKADLLVEGSYAAAMQDCELVYHTASPFLTVVEDPQRDLVEPAVLGTRNVLSQANKTESVKRVVLTSSCAAIYGDNIDLLKTPEGVYTEDIWNTTSSLDYQPYSFSKLLAEKEAWKINQKQNRWDLVVINPSLIMGPALNPQTVTSESFRLMKQFGDGSVKNGIPDIGFGVVDVRDVAIAHYQAGFNSQAQGRHIISGHNTSLLDMAKTLLPKYGKEYPIPDKKLPKWLIWLVGPIINKAMSRKYVAKNIGYPFKADNSKSINSLGIQYRPLEDSMNDMFQQVITYNDLS